MEQIPEANSSCGPADGVSWSLVELRAQNQNAWREAYRELWRIAHNCISHRVLSHESIQDLCQETLLVVASTINSFADERHIKAMTAVIAQRKASHYLRDEIAGKRDRRRETTIEAAAEVEAALPQAQSLLDLETALEKLERLDRDLLEGHFLSGLKSHELAERLGLNANTVRGRIKRAMDRLRTEFSVQFQPTGEAP